MTDTEPDTPQATPAALAERAVLGAMLTSPAAIDDVLEVPLTGHDYASHRNELIHDAIVALHTAGHPVDALTVADKLGPDLQSIGGLPYLFDATSHAPVPSAVTHHADIVRAASQLRAVDAAATRIHQAVEQHDPRDDILDLVNHARAELDNLTTADTRTIPNHDAVYQAMEDLETGTPGIPTPWSYLTNVIAGWKPACLYLIGARPAVGKSVAGNTIALDVARRGQTAMIFSLEMSRTELYHRLFSAVGTIDAAHLQHRRLSPGDWEHLATAGSHISELPLHVDDRTALSLAQIRAAIKTEQRKSDVGVVIIDYLQLITPPAGTPRDDRRVQVDAISRGLKNLAKDCNVPVIALTQLNRGPEGRADKAPLLSDLREAGGQEQDADVVILMHRDVTGRDKLPTELHLSVAKNRHGSSANLELLFRGEYSRIEEAPWSPSAHLTKDAS